MAMHRMVSTMSVFPLLQCAQAEGIPVAALLAGSRLSESLLRDAGAMVPFAEELVVVRNYLALAQAQNGHPGLAASVYYHYNSFGVLGAALVSHSDMLAACRFLAHYVELTFTPFFISLSETPTHLEASYIDRGDLGDCREFYLIRDLAFLRNLCQEADAEHWPGLIEGMDIALPPPAQAEALRDFFRWPIRFDAEATVIRASTARLQQPLRLANPVTLALMQRQCDELLAQRAPASWRGQVERILRTDPNADPALVADRLCCSERSLRRHLQQEGCTFQEMATGLQHQRALQFLQHSRLTVETIAHRLGYSETAAFVHAFKRWTGQTPSQYRSSCSQPE